MTKFLSGLFLALLIGWICHGPLGKGQSLIDDIERDVRSTSLPPQTPPFTVRMQREPLARVAHVRTANQHLGIEGAVLAVPGVSDVRWEITNMQGGSELEVLERAVQNELGRRAAEDGNAAAR